MITTIKLGPGNKKQILVNISGIPRRGGVSTNSVEDRGQRER
jgi:hypothetical protein